MQGFQTRRQAAYRLLHDARLFKLDIEQLLLVCKDYRVMPSELDFLRLAYEGLLERPQGNRPPRYQNPLYEEKVFTETLPELFSHGHLNTFLDMRRCQRVGEPDAGLYAEFTLKKADPATGLYIEARIGRGGAKITVAGRNIFLNTDYPEALDEVIARNKRDFSSGNFRSYPELKDYLDDIFEPLIRFFFQECLRFDDFPLEPPITDAEQEVELTVEELRSGVPAPANPGYPEHYNHRLESNLLDNIPQISFAERYALPRNPAPLQTPEERAQSMQNIRYSRAAPTRRLPGLDDVPRPRSPLPRPAPNGKQQRRQ